MSKCEARLAEMGITLPSPSAPVANYLPFARTGNIIHISGQISNDGTGRVRGTVGGDLSTEDGIDAARICGINLLAQMKAAAGNLDNVVRVIKLNGYVQAGADFQDIPKVINGCSDLLVAVFGDAGKHARSAVGVYKLPLGFAVEIDATIEVMDRR